MTQSAALFETIRQLEAARPLRPDTAGPIIGVLFKKDDAASNPARVTFAGAGAGELVRAARLQQPASPAWGTGGTLALEIGGPAITQAEVIAQWGDEHSIIVPTPREPPGSPMALRYRRPWATISFVFPMEGDGLLSVQIAETD